MIDSQGYGMDVDLPVISKNVFADKGEFFKNVLLYFLTLFCFREYSQ